MLRNPVMLRFLALGDSYTIGEGVSPRERWPVQLAALLVDRGVPCAEPEIIAQTGWTTDELARAVARMAPQGTFDLVSLLIGVNNQYRGRSRDEYGTQFADMLRQAITFAGGRPKRVLVLSIPDWGVTPFRAERGATGVGADIDAFNTINREISYAMSVPYVDITSVSRELTGAAMFAPDGLHPSGEMYTLWAELALPAALAALADAR